MVTWHLSARGGAMVAWSISAGSTCAGERANALAVAEWDAGLLKSTSLKSEMTPKAVDCLAKTWAYCTTPSSSSQAAARVIDAFFARAHGSAHAPLWKSPRMSPQ
jgi:hypothetical protein